jgi:hypothetical protein
MIQGNLEYYLFIIEVLPDMEYHLYFSFGTLKAVLIGLNEWRPPKSLDVPCFMH